MWGSYLGRRDTPNCYCITIISCTVVAAVAARDPASTSFNPYNENCTSVTSGCMPGSVGSERLGEIRGGQEAVIGFHELSTKLSSRIQLHDSPSQSLNF